LIFFVSPQFPLFWRDEFIIEDELVDFPGLAYRVFRSPLPRLLEGFGRPKLIHLKRIWDKRLKDLQNYASCIQNRKEFRHRGQISLKNPLPVERIPFVPTIYHHLLYPEGRLGELARNRCRVLGPARHPDIETILNKDHWSAAECLVLIASPGKLWGDVAEFRANLLQSCRVPLNLDRLDRLLTYPPKEITAFATDLRKEFPDAPEAAYSEWFKPKNQSYARNLVFLCLDIWEEVSE